MLNDLKNFIDAQAPNTVFISVRVIPKTQKTEVSEYLSDGSWKIRVKAVPEKGKANDEIESFLKKQLSAAEVEVCVGKKIVLNLYAFKRHKKRDAVASLFLSWKIIGILPQPQDCSSCHHFSPQGTRE
jgi:hypothetical protein